MILLKLFELATNWRKTTVDQFMKKFNTDQKDRILHIRQKKVFESKYQEYQNMRIKNNIDKEKDSVRDKEIKDNALKAGHEVKDGRVEVLTLEGSDRWVNKQG